ncbi:MAG: hypothetical protein IT460_14705 [Planctomycetes bacterium]|nr:hypothetical protein [Planctomycetota bacterium]
MNERLGGPPASWDEVVGTRVLVGVARVDARGDVVGREQWAGVVVSASARQGVAVRPDGEEGVRVLPPALPSFRRAAPGRYVLKETGAVVEDPDWVATFTVRVDPDEPPARLRGARRRRAR